MTISTEQITDIDEKIKNAQPTAKRGKKPKQSKKSGGLSIKQRIVFFYSAIIALLVIVFGAFTLYIGHDLSEDISRAALENAVKAASDNLSHYNDRIVVGPDMDFFASGVSITLYDSNGIIIAGSVPSTFPSGIVLLNDEYRSIKDEEETFAVYDLKVILQDSSIWIRGIYSMNNNIATFKSISELALICLPVILVLAILIGYSITKRAFRPVARMASDVEHINEGSDLTKRIELPASRDELYELAVTLNGMISRLEHAFENERQFTSDVSHELRTPLAVIRSQCEYALDPARTADERMECLQAVYRQQVRMSALTEQLLELSRGLNRKGLLRYEHIILYELCESVIEEMQPIAAERDIKILSRLDRAAVINGDRTLLFRLLINLVSNAIRYGRDGGFVMITLEGTQNEAKISVADNGIGIRKENIDRVFNRFFREDSSRSGGVNSFGLGLSFVKWAAEAHGGSVSVESVKDVGSTFVVHLTEGVTDIDENIAEKHSTTRRRKR